jgi:phage shock protein A
VLVDEDGDGSIDYQEIARVGNIRVDIKKLTNKVAVVEQQLRAVEVRQQQQQVQQQVQQHQQHQQPLTALLFTS